MNLYCTQALLKQLKETAAEPTQSTARLSYWTCKGLVHERKRYVLALNRETMLVLLVRAAPGASLRERLADALEAGLLVFGVGEEDAAAEAALMRAASFCKSIDRSLQGTLVGLASHVPFLMWRLFDGSGESLLAVAERLSVTPHVNREPMFAHISLADVFGL